MPGCKGTSLPPPANGHCHVALSPECPGAQERDRQAGCCPPPPQLCPPPCRALQGAAGDSSPSELSYVSFLLGWGRGGESAPGGGEAGSAAVSSAQAWEGGGQGPGWAIGRESPPPCHPLPNNPSDLLGASRKLEAQGCFASVIHQERMNRLLSCPAFPL